MQSLSPGWGVVVYDAADIWGRGGWGADMHLWIGMEQVYYYTLQ
jgi:hypothetical protein